MNDPLPERSITSANMRGDGAETVMRNLSIRVTQQKNNLNINMGPEKNEFQCILFFLSRWFSSEFTVTHLTGLALQVSDHLRVLHFIHMTWKKAKDLLNYFLFTGLAIKIVFLSHYFISQMPNAGAVESRLFSALASKGTLRVCVCWMQVLPHLLERNVWPQIHSLQQPQTHPDPGSAGTLRHHSPQTVASFLHSAI